LSQFTKPARRPLLFGLLRFVPTRLVRGCLHFAAARAHLFLFRQDN
jgi:hypothetical protein